MVKIKATDIPLLYQYDVIVCGGGVAGIATALASVRKGSKTMLIENQYALGGLATLGLITIFKPLCDGRGNQIIFGIGEELLRLSVKYGFEDRFPDKWICDGTKEEKAKQRFEVRYNPTLFSIAAEQLLHDEGVDILYGTKVIGALCQDGHIDNVILNNKEGTSAATAKVFVDASGDADVCAFSGEKTEVFKENRFNFWYYSEGKKGYSLSRENVNISGDLPSGERFYDGTRQKDVSDFMIRNHKEVLLDVIKKRKAGDENLFPVTIQTLPPIRMTRRLKGEYELAESEEGKSFKDTVGMTGDWRYRGPVFSIPFRCIKGVKNDNLLCAGRCISVKNDMWDITRAIPTCCVTGEAAGVAAALSVREKMTVRELSVSLLQEELKIKVNK